MRFPLALVLVSTIAAAQPAKLSEGLLWNVAPVRGDRTGPTSVSWIDGKGAVAWTHALPEALQFSIHGRDAKTLDWLAKQRASNYTTYWSVARIGDAILISDAGAVLVIGISDGKTRFEWNDPRPQNERGGFDSALMDRGAVTVTMGGKSCTQKVDRQSFVIPCGDNLIYFGDATLTVIQTSPWKLVATIEARGPDLNDLAGKCPGERKKDVDKTFTVGAATVHAVGVRATFCQT